MMGTEQQIRDTLENLVDKHSLSHILGSMQDVCVKKAKHIRDNWQLKDDQDTETVASDWDAAGQHINNVLCRITV